MGLRVSIDRDLHCIIIYNILMISFNRFFPFIHVTIYLESYESFIDFPKIVNTTMISIPFVGLKSTRAKMTRVF